MPERRLGGFASAQVGLALVLAGTRANKFFVAQDAVRGAFADGQIKHVHKTTGTEAWRRFLSWRNRRFAHSTLKGAQLKPLAPANPVSAEPPPQNRVLAVTEKIKTTFHPNG
jgi:hypothetical protein